MSSGHHGALRLVCNMFDNLTRKQELLATAIMMLVIAASLGFALGVLFNRIEMSELVELPKV